MDGREEQVPRSVSPELLVRPGLEPYLANAHDHGVAPRADRQALRLDVQFHDSLSAVERRTL